MADWIPWIISLVCLGMGALFAYMDWETSGYGEYTGFWWLGWILMSAGGVSIMAYIADVRTSYVTITFIAGAVATLCFLAGRIEDEFLPPAWLGLGFIVAAVSLLSANMIGFSTPIVVGICGAVAFFAMVFGKLQRDKGEYGYDAGYLVGGAFATTAILLLLGVLPTPLERLNNRYIPDLNESLSDTKNALENYAQAEEQALEYREILRLEFAEETDGGTFLLMADEWLAKADSLRAQASAEFEKAGQKETLRTAYNPEDERRILQRIEHANSARTFAVDALDSFDSIRRLTVDVSQTVIVTYLWTEIADYWPSESSYTKFKACYYGIRTLYTIPQLQLVPDDDPNTPEEFEVEETGVVIKEHLTSDENGRPDLEGKGWRIFKPEDYRWLVNNGLIPPMTNGDTDDITDIGNYLCKGHNGQEAFIQEGTVVVKENGVLIREMDDGENALLGNYDYGQWCTVHPETGEILSTVAEGEIVPEGDPNLTWCWYIQPGEDTGYYYSREEEIDENGHSHIFWHRYGSRCYYCSSQRWGGSGHLVPDRQLSQMNGTDASTVRGPAAIGGGPNAGK